MRSDTAWTREDLASPHGAPDKADRVRQMFDAIAPRYELVNSVFSGGLDSRWRRAAVAKADVRPEDDVLDIACGTGDFARTFAKAGPRSVLGCDFSHEMLALARSGTDDSIGWCEADALALPFDDGSFSITSCAFGVRNFQDLGAGLGEMHRVLRPGGRLVILEFTRPRRRIIRYLYELYATKFMPLAASWLSRDRSGAYRYLPRSVVSFLDAEQMCERIRNAGFADVAATPLTLGVVTVYIGRRN